MLFVLSLTGCSFDASKLRVPVTKDGALAASPDSSRADGPLALDDVFRETGALDENAALDVPATDTPVEAPTG